MDEESEGTSPASTPYTKSRPTTASSRENETEGDEEEEEGTEKVWCKKDFNDFNPCHAGIFVVC